MLPCTGVYDHVPCLFITVRGTWEDPWYYVYRRVWYFNDMPHTYHNCSLHCLEVGKLLGRFCPYGAHCVSNRTNDFVARWFYYLILATIVYTTGPWVLFCYNIVPLPLFHKSICSCLKESMLLHCMFKHEGCTRSFFPEELFS